MNNRVRYVGIDRHASKDHILENSQMLGEPLTVDAGIVKPFTDVQNWLARFTYSVYENCATVTHMGVPSCLLGVKRMSERSPRESTGCSFSYQTDVEWSEAAH